MPVWLISIFIVLFGLAFGSFLNVCISRLPRHESIARPRSRCPKCRAEIRSRDNVPVLSWILLRGRCRTCGWRIPWRYPAVEFATAALFLLCFLRFGLTLYGMGMAVFCFLLLGLAVMDAETMRLPDAFTWTGVALGIAFAFLEPHSGIDHRLWETTMDILWATLAALIMILIRGSYFLIRGREGMGWGDVKLFAMIAAWLNPIFALLTLFLAVLSAAVLGVLWVGFSRRSQNALTARLPFGSFLCAAAIYAIFAGEPILRWYLQFFR